MENKTQSRDLLAHRWFKKHKKNVFAYSVTWLWVSLDKRGKTIEVQTVPYVSLNTGRINPKEADLGNKVKAIRIKIIFCGRAC